MARSVRVYEIAWNARFVVVDGARGREFRVVVEIPRNGYKVTADGSLDVDEVVEFLGELERLPEASIPRIAELLARSLGRLTGESYRKLTGYEKALGVLERTGSVLAACRAADIPSSECPRGEEEARKTLEDLLEREKQRFQHLRKLERLAVVLLSALKVPSYADAIKISIEAKEYEGPLKKILSQQQQQKAEAKAG